MGVFVGFLLYKERERERERESRVSLDLGMGFPKMAVSIVGLFFHILRRLIKGILRGCQAFFGRNLPVLGGFAFPKPAKSGIL